MKRILIGLCSAIAGYAVAAAGGYFLIAALSSNTHDRALEAAMTAAFVCGPLGAIAGFVAGFVASGRGARAGADSSTSAGT